MLESHSWLYSLSGLCLIGKGKEVEGEEEVELGIVCNLTVHPFQEIDLEIEQFAPLK